MILKTSSGVNLRQILGFTHMCVVKNGVRGVHARANVDINYVLLAVDGHGPRDIVADRIPQGKGLW